MSIQIINVIIVNVKCSHKMSLDIRDGRTAQSQGKNDDIIISDKIGSNHESHSHTQRK